MPLLSFEKRFADAVTSGSKTLTIRAMRKQPIYAGDRLHLFTGAYRSGERRRLSPIDGVSCVESRLVTICREGATTGIIIVDGCSLDRQMALSLIQSDGWVTDGKVRVRDFFDYFLSRNKYFEGQLIRWKWWGEPIDATDPKIWKPEAHHA